VRWRLLLITSFAAAIIGSALWCAAVAIFFGPSGLLDARDSLWPISYVIPLALAAAAGFFVYRHTSRRRKFQAIAVTLIVLILTALTTYIAADSIPQYLTLPPNRGAKVVP
jgi:hypothetical protein